MTDPSDVPADMTGASPLDDRTADRLLRGRAVDGQPELAAFVAGLSGLTTPLPEPRGDLVALLAHGADAAAAARSEVPAWPPVRRRGWGRPAARVGLSVGAKLLLGSGVAVAGVTSAAGAGMLPGPVQDGVAEVVRTMTPFELPTSQSTQPPTPPVDDETQAPAPRVPREDVVVPRRSPEPTAQVETQQPKPSPTRAPTPTPTPTSTSTPSATPEPTQGPAESPSPTPTESATGEAAAADDPSAEAAPEPRGNGGPKPSRSPGGGGRPSQPPAER